MRLYIAIIGSFLLVPLCSYASVSISLPTVDQLSVSASGNNAVGIFNYGTDTHIGQSALPNNPLFNISDGFWTGRGGQHIKLYDVGAGVNYCIGQNMAWCDDNDSGTPAEFWVLADYSGFSLTEPSSKPTVTTSSTTEISYYSALVAGSVVSDGGATITSRGFRYGTSTNYGATTTQSGTTGDFSYSLSGLSASTTYHARAYAINSAGVGYGADDIFVTSILPSWIIATTSAQQDANSISFGLAIIISLLFLMLCGYLWNRLFSKKPWL